MPPSKSTLMAWYTTAFKMFATLLRLLGQSGRPSSALQLSHGRADRQIGDGGSDLAEALSCSAEARATPFIPRSYAASNARTPPTISRPIRVLPARRREITPGLRGLTTLGPGRRTRPNVIGLSDLAHLCLSPIRANLPNEAPSAGGDQGRRESVAIKKDRARMSRRYRTRHIIMGMSRGI